MPASGTGCVGATSPKKPKPRKLDVYNFKDACKALRAALDEIDRLKLANASNTAAVEAEIRRRNTAEADAKAAREHFADLKRRLHESEREVSRLNGYMQRVHEDDAVADPLVEVQDGQGKRMVSKRYPSGSIRVDSSMFAENSYEIDTYGRRVEKKHWVTY